MCTCSTASLICRLWAPTLRTTATPRLAASQTSRQCRCRVCPATSAAPSATAQAAARQISLRATLPLLAARCRPPPGTSTVLCCARRTLNAVPQPVWCSCRLLCCAVRSPGSRQFFVLVSKLSWSLVGSAFLQVRASLASVASRRLQFCSQAFVADQSEST
jgi:hypothetical protein